MERSLIQEQLDAHERAEELGTWNAALEKTLLEQAKKVVHCPEVDPAFFKGKSRSKAAEECEAMAEQRRQRAEVLLKLHLRLFEEETNEIRTKANPGAQRADDFAGMQGGVNLPLKPEFEQDPPYTCESFGVNWADVHFTQEAVESEDESDDEGPSRASSKPSSRDGTGGKPRGAASAVDVCAASSRTASKSSVGSTASASGTVSEGAVSSAADSLTSGASQGGMVAGKKKIRSFKDRRRARSFSVADQRVWETLQDATAASRKRAAAAAEAASKPPSPQQEGSANPCPWPSAGSKSGSDASTSGGGSSAADSGAANTPKNGFAFQHELLRQILELPCAGETECVPCDDAGSTSASPQDSAPQPPRPGRNPLGFCDDLYATKIAPQMREIVNASLLSAQGSVENRKGSTEIYGFDFMVDEDLKVWLIEINSSPAMDYSTPITTPLVKQVMEDTVKVIVDEKCSTMQPKFAPVAPPAATGTGQAAQFSSPVPAASATAISGDAAAPPDTADLLPKSPSSPKSASSGVKGGSTAGSPTLPVATAAVDGATPPLPAHTPTLTATPNTNGPGPNNRRTTHTLRRKIGEWELIYLGTGAVRKTQQFVGKLEVPGKQIVNPRKKKEERKANANKQWAALRKRKAEIAAAKDTADAKVAKEKNERSRSVGLEKPKKKKPTTTGTVGTKSKSTGTTTPKPDTEKDKTATAATGD